MFLFCKKNVKIFSKIFLSFQQRRWIRRLCLFHKFLWTGQLSHIHFLLPQMRNSDKYPNTFHVFPCRTEYFKNSFFPYVINELNKLVPNIRSSSNDQIFRNALLKFVKPVKTKFFNVNDPFGIKMLTRLTQGFSHLREHKFRHGFKNALNSLCSCNIEAETTTRYFLHCHFCNSNQANLMNDLENTAISFSIVSDNNLISLLLYGDDKFNDTKN